LTWLDYADNRNSRPTLLGYQTVENKDNDNSQGKINREDGGETGGRDAGADN